MLRDDSKYTDKHVCMLSSVSKIGNSFTSNVKSVFTSNFFFLKIVNSTQIWKILFLSQSLDLRARSFGLLQSSWQNWAFFSGWELDNFFYKICRDFEVQTKKSARGRNFCQRYFNFWKVGNFIFRWKKKIIILDLNWRFSNTPGHVPLCGRDLECFFKYVF